MGHIVRAVLLADGHTDMKKPVGAFRMLQSQACELHFTSYGDQASFQQFGCNDPVIHINERSDYDLPFYIINMIFIF